MADRKSHTGRAKLNKAGVGILEEYVRLHPDDTHPTTITQKSLLEQIRGIQDNSDIKLRSVSGWFKRRHIKGQQSTVQPQQQQQQQQQQVTIPLTPTSPTTLFTQESLQSLHTLIQATPNPGPSVLDIWASLFRVSLPVLGYAIKVVLPSHFPSTSQATSSTHQTQSNHTNFDQKFRHSSHSQRLPTPSDSLTPEPIPTDQWSYHRKSPEYLKSELHFPMLESSRSEPSTSHHQNDRPNEGATRPLKSSAPGSNTVSTVDPGVRLQPSPPLTPVVPTAKPKPKMPPLPPASSTSISSPIQNLLPRVSPLTNAIASGVTEACLDAASKKNEQSSPAPKTAAEFNALFAPYQAKLEDLSRILDAAPKPKSQSFQSCR